MKTNLLRRLVALAALLLSVSWVQAGDLTIKGSDTMQVMNQSLAQGYMKTNPGVNLSVSGGGSGVGIAALLSNTTDIAAASRLVKPKEDQEFLLQTGVKPKHVPVALDGVAIFVNSSNPVSELTIAQLGKIFDGEFTSWKQVGGNDQPITVYSRETSSGTYSFIKDEVLAGKDYTSQAQTLQGTAAVYDAVSKDVQGIGYGGIGYNQGVKLLKVKADDKSPGYVPTEENVDKKLYPLARTLNYYLNPRTTNPDAIKYISWVLSPEGQKIVVSCGYYALPAADVATISADLNGTTAAAAAPSPTPVPLATPMTEPMASVPGMPHTNPMMPATPMETPIPTPAPMVMVVPMPMPGSGDQTASTYWTMMKAMEEREERVLVREEKIASREAAVADRESKMNQRELDLIDKEKVTPTPKKH